MNERMNDLIHECTYIFVYLVILIDGEVIIVDKRGWLIQ